MDIFYSYSAGMFLLFNSLSKKCVYFILLKTSPSSIISFLNQGYSPGIHTILFRQLKVLLKVFLINFLAVYPPQIFTKYALTVVKSIGNINFIASQALFRTTIYNSFTNIVFAAMSVFKFTYLLRILTKLGTFTVTSGTFRLFVVSLSILCPLPLSLLILIPKEV